MCLFTVWASPTKLITSPRSVSLSPTMNRLGGRDLSIAFVAIAGFAGAVLSRLTLPRYRRPFSLDVVATSRAVPRNTGSQHTPFLATC